MKWMFRWIALAALALMYRPPIEEEELTPEEWEDLRESLGDALRPDGSIDLDRLSEIAVTLDIDEWKRELNNADSSVAVSDHS